MSKNKKYENQILINKFLKSKKYEILKTNFKTNSGNIEYIVKEPEDKDFNIVYFSKNKRLNKKLEEDLKNDPKNIRNGDYGRKIRFIIVQNLNFMNYNREFNRKKISKRYLKERQVLKNIFNYLTVNKVKELPALDMIQVFNHNDIKKIKYRKNIVSLKEFTNFDLLRDAI